jgi:hypothetical protein
MLIVSAIILSRTRRAFLIWRESVRDVLAEKFSKRVLLSERHNQLVDRRESRHQSSVLQHWRQHCRNQLRLEQVCDRLIDKRQSMCLGNFWQYWMQHCRNQSRLIEAIDRLMVRRDSMYLRNFWQYWQHWRSHNSNQSRLEQACARLNQRVLTRMKSKALNRWRACVTNAKEKKLADADNHVKTLQSEAAALERRSAEKEEAQKATQRELERKLRGAEVEAQKLKRDLRVQKRRREAEKRVAGNAT